MMETLVEGPLSSVKAPLTEESIVIALREILPSMNANTATLKTVMQNLVARFGMEFADFKAQWRSRIKALLPDLMDLCADENSSGNHDDRFEGKVQNEKAEIAQTLRRSKKRNFRTRNTIVDSSDEENDADDVNSSEESVGKASSLEENEADDVNSSEESVGKASNLEENDEDGKSDQDNFQKMFVPISLLLSLCLRLQRTSIKKKKKKKNKGMMPPAKRSRTTKQPDSAGLASLKELGRAAGVLKYAWLMLEMFLLYKVLNNAASTADAEEILRDRLHDAGISFSGSYPSSRDISAAKRKRAKDKELEGIDTSLIISDGRPRRGSAQQVSYHEERISGEEDNIEEEEDDEESVGPEEDDEESVGPGESDSDSTF
ncbi:hypothetical protein PsorP6_004099 [Peronosclerospora sorghi]|uniref:Uncharacterized protein n=1 Tax=Peronosclerospora sorghi TaxID=230839 RepID=A0ACC0VQX2_9STRA|nr:hypothetical protein PsorP6_004099 [Peronosclerospora sorghi]